MFPFHRNIRKKHLSTNAYSCVNMKFLYTIAVCKDKVFYVVPPIAQKNKQFFASLYVNFSLMMFKQKDEIFYIVLQRKQVIGQLVVEDICIFLIISCRKRDRRIDDYFFFLLHGNKCSFNLLIF